MSIKSRLALAFSLVLTLVLFQNCGAFKSGQSDTATSSGPAPLVTGDGEFQQGDAFDPSSVPFNITDQSFIDAMGAYMGRAGFKALAFNEDGIGYMASTTNPLVADQNEWNRAVLERCHLTTRKPCSLFAEGDFVAQNAEDFHAGYVPVIEVPADGQFDGAKIPGLINHWRNHAVSRYAPFEPGETKAYAIGPHGNTSAGWSTANLAEARRRALQYCEALDGSTGCILYAENTIVVFNLDNFSFPAPTIQYAPSMVDFNDIPFVTDARMETIRSAGTAALQAGNHFLITVARYGHSSFLESATPISQQQIDDTVADCKAKIPAVDPSASNQDPTCVVYSIDNEIKMTRDSLMEAFY